MVDRRKDRSAYKQIADDYRRRIRGGEFKPGEPLPSEGRIRQETGQGIDTVKQAMDVLRWEGLISSERGRRSWVRIPKSKTEIPLRDGDKVIARMPIGDEREEFEADTGVPLVEIRRAGADKPERYLGDAHFFVVRSSQNS